MNLKALKEQRNNLKSRMVALVASAKAEHRALSDDDADKFAKYHAAIDKLDAEIKKEEKRNMSENTHKKNEQTVEQREVSAFAAYVRSVANREQRTETQLTKGDNGAVIPKTIVAKIIEKVENISPVYKLATKYTVPGTVNVPKEDTSSDHITVAYATDFTDLTSHSNKFATIELTGFLYGALTKISKSLLKNSDFQLTDWVVNKMSKNIAKFIEGECLNGTTNKVSGVAGSFDSTNMKVTLASKTAVTADELIDIQELVPDVFQSESIWVMSKDTRKKIRKLKDGQGNYLLEKDSTSKWGYRLLNNDVYVSDNAANLGTVSKNVIFFGDFSGLAVKESEAPEIQILNEMFAAQHAIGVVAWGELDAKVEDTQKIAVAVTPAS